MKLHSFNDSIKKKKSKNVTANSCRPVVALITSEEAQLALEST